MYTGFAPCHAIHNSSRLHRRAYQADLQRSRRGQGLCSGGSGDGVPLFKGEWRGSEEKAIHGSRHQGLTGVAVIPQYKIGNRHGGILEKLIHNSPLFSFMAEDDGLHGHFPAEVSEAWQQNPDHETERQKREMYTNPTIYVSNRALTFS